jgi:hypothetical protein
VKKGDTLFMGQYLFTGSETTSVWLEVCGFLISQVNDILQLCVPYMLQFAGCGNFWGKCKLSSEECSYT